VLAAIVFLIARNSGDDGDEPGIDVVDDAGPGGTDSIGLDGVDAGGADDDGGVTGSRGSGSARARPTVSSCS